MRSLDTLDFKILTELDGNARISFSELARRLKQARDLVEYRYHRLVERQIITGSTAVLNPWALGMKVFRVCIRAKRDQRAQKKIAELCRNHPNVYWFALSTGRWDFVYVLFARDIQDFFNLHHEMLRKFESAVTESDVYELVNTCFASKSYLHAGSTKKTFELAPVATQDGKEGEKFDAVDLEILSTLVAFAQITDTELASRLSLSQPGVRYRIERLKRLGVLAGFRALINLDLINRLLFKVQIVIGPIGVRGEEQLKKRALTYPEITFYGRQIGTAAIDVELECASLEQCDQILNDLAGSVNGGILNTDISLLKQTWLEWKPDLFLRNAQKG